MMNERLQPYMLGLVDGFEIAQRIHRRHFFSVPGGSPTLKRALMLYNRDVQRAADLIQKHRLGNVAAFFGFDDVWTPERAARLRELAPLEVEVDEAAVAEHEAAIGGKSREKELP